MCVVSMVTEHWRDKWFKPSPTFTPYSGQTTTFIQTINPVTREEFNALKKDVQELAALLARAKEYDRRNNEPDCEMDEKVALVKKVAEMVGVELPI